MSDHRIVKKKVKPKSKKNLPGAAEVKAKLDEFISWRSSLSPLDRMNFDTLVDLPSGPKIVAQMAQEDKHKKFTEMAAVALGIKGRLKELVAELVKLGVA